MQSTSDTLKEVKELFEAGWAIRWDGRTGGEYPPNQRIVEFEKSLDDESYTRVRKLHLLEKDYREVEKLREDGDNATEGGDENDADEGEDRDDQADDESESDEE